MHTIRDHRGALHRGYLISRAAFGEEWVVRHHRHGLEVTETVDGRAWLVTWASVDDAMAAIDATYELPESSSTPPRMRTAA